MATKDCVLEYYQDGAKTDMYVKTKATLVEGLDAAVAANAKVTEIETNLNNLTNNQVGRKSADGGEIFNSAVSAATNSQAAGNGTIAKSQNQHVFGKFNEVDNNGEYVIIVGAGENTNSRKNALAIKWDGTIVSDQLTQILTSINNKAVNVHLWSDGAGIMYFDKKDTGEYLTFNDVKSIIENDTNSVFLTNGYYSMYSKYVYREDITGDEKRAIGFIGITKLHDRAYLWRVLIDEENNLTEEEMELASAEQVTLLTNKVTELDDKVEKILKKEAKIYGFNILKNESDPAARVVYTDDAVGMTPAGISGTDTFSYGSWKDAFFMPRPCMIKSNGTVDYYLNPNNFKEKLDGTESDVTNLAYDGNAMMEWDKIYWKYIPTDDEIEGGFRVSNVKVDDTYHCWCNINNNDKEVDHFYTNIYNGTGTDKLRSMSGIQISPTNGNGNTNTTTETTRAQANGTGWYIETWADRLLMTGLLLLMGKSTNTQAVFGAGLTGGAQADKEAYITGTLDDKGLFYGSTDNKTAVKCFGMENFYGCVYHRVAGCILSAHKLLTKLTWGKADGSTVIGYNQNGNGYVETTTSAEANGYVKAMNFTERGFVASDATGTATTYYCDYFYQNTGTYYLLVGGSASVGSFAGACYFDLRNAGSSSYWNIAAALSFKPLV